MSNVKFKKSWLDESGKLLIRLGANEKGQVCVQIIMNIPLEELVASALPQEKS